MNEEALAQWSLSHPKQTKTLFLRIVLKQPGGCSTKQATSRRSLTAEDRIRSLASLCVIFRDRSDPGRGLSKQQSIGFLPSENAFYYSVQNLLSSNLLSKNLKIKLYKTVILPFVLYGCKTWSLKLREESRLRV